MTEDDINHYKRRCNLFEAALEYAARLGHEIEEWIEHVLHHKHHHHHHHDYTDGG